MRRFTAALLLCLAATSLDAREMRLWTYEQLMEEAALVVIATPVRVTDTGEKTTLPGIWRTSGAPGDNESRPIPAIRMRTDFDVLVVMKGDEELATFTLVHLRESDPPEAQLDGPGLVAFEPEEKKRFLLFLAKDPSGDYVPLTGQTDPDVGIRDLGNYP